MSTQVLIAIIIGSTFLLVAIVTGIAAVLSKAGDSSPGIILLKRILGSLWKVLYIIWYPIQAIIEFFHGIGYRFYLWLHDAFKTEEYKKSKTQRLIRNAISTVLHNHSNLLNSYLNRRIAKTLTLLLQLISAVTTYAGFVFFSDH